jgi:hypothetical protein
MIDNEKRSITETPSSNLFKFGDNKIIESNKIVTQGIYENVEPYFATNCFSTARIEKSFIEGLSKKAIIGLIKICDIGFVPTG